MPATSGDSGNSQGLNLGFALAGGQGWPFHSPADGDEGRNQLDSGQTTGNQTGAIEHAQNRTGDHSAGLSGTPGQRSESGVVAPGREDIGPRKPPERLRTALDALERVVSELATACQKLGQRIVAYRERVSRDAERRDRGISR